MIEHEYECDCCGIEIEDEAAAEVVDGVLVCLDCYEYYDEFEERRKPR